MEGSETTGTFFKAHTPKVNAVVLSRPGKALFGLLRARLPRLGQQRLDKRSPDSGWPHGVAIVLDLHAPWRKVKLIPQIVS